MQDKPPNKTPTPRQPTMRERLEKAVEYANSLPGDEPLLVMPPKWVPPGTPPPDNVLPFRQRSKVRVEDGV